jgi:hypothetical protein
MKRPLTLLSMFAAIATVLAGPAMAGNDIVKCVDAAGHVTLTDQPCAAGAASVRLEQDNAAADVPANAAADAPAGVPNRSTAAPRRYVLPAVDLRQGAWRRPDLSRPAPLAQDVATLKAARRMLMLQDARPTLAGLP